MKEKVSGIYAIKHTATGKMYVGSAINIDKRWGIHRYDLKKGKHHSPYLQHAWNKYGANAFSWVILERCPERSLIEREQTWIDATRSCDPTYGYNLAPTAGSTLGTHRDDDSKERSSQALTNHFSALLARQHFSMQIKEAWQDPTYRTAHEEAAKKLHNRNPNLIKAMRAKRKDYSMMSYVRSFRKPGNQFELWTTEQEEILRQQYPKIGARRLSPILGRSENSIRMRAAHMGLRFKSSPESKGLRIQIALAREQKRRELSWQLQATK